MNVPSASLYLNSEPREEARWWGSTSVLQVGQGNPGNWDGLDIYICLNTVLDLTYQHVLLQMLS